MRSVFYTVAGEYLGSSDDGAGDEIRPGEIAANRFKGNGKSHSKWEVMSVTPASNGVQ